MQDKYEILDNFIDHINYIRTGSEATSDSYRRDVSRFLSFLDDNDIDDLNDVDRNLVFDYISELRSGKITRGKISNSTYARNMKMETDGQGLDMFPQPRC